MQSSGDKRESKFKELNIVGAEDNREAVSRCQTSEGIVNHKGVLPNTSGYSSFKHQVLWSDWGGFLFLNHSGEGVAEEQDWRQEDQLGGD